jgi:hypothetical protein
MGLELSATVPLVSRLYTHRVVVDGQTREVTTNLSLQDLAAAGCGVAWLVRLAREHGRPVQDGAT